MACTKEEIEIKRLAAIQKRLSNLTKPNVYTSTESKDTVSPQTSNVGPLKHTTGSHVGFHPYSKPEKCQPYGMNNVQKFENKHGAQSLSPVNKVVTATVQLISENRFEVILTEFCIPLVNIFKSIPSASFDLVSKIWTFSIEHYQELITKSGQLEPHVLTALPAFVLKILEYPVLDPNTVKLSPIEETLRTKLMSFQEDGVRFVIARRGRCMIADEMGLGKTYQALAIASYYRKDWPLLIVTNSSMRETWQNKIHELLPSVAMANVATLTSGKDSQLVADKQTEIVIISFKIATTHQKLLQEKNFGMIIVDESHYLKSYKAQCTSVLLSVGKRCKRVLLLSGTPALSRPSELYTQLALIEPTIFNSYNSYIQFGIRYCDGKQTNFGWDMSGRSNLSELQVLLHKRFLIRRTKDRVLTHLGDIKRESIILDETLVRYTKEEEQGLSQMAKEYCNSKSSEKHAVLITYFSKSAVVKRPAVCKYIKQLLKEHKGKFLVFAHHRIMIEGICNTLDETNTPFICIMGSTPANTRADLVDKFQNKKSVRCAVLSITAANSGLTLTAAELVLFAELHWNPGILIQAESRAHRLGQSGFVCARYLRAKGTADDYMWPMLQDKLNVLNDVGLSGETFEDTAMKHQENPNNITQYLSPKPRKNRNDYIPGTNIRKNSLCESHVENVEHANSQKTLESNLQTAIGSNSQNGSNINFEIDLDSMFVDDEIDDFALNHDEDDDLLANLNMDDL